MKKNKGFTLLELAISLLIIGLLLAGILGPLSTSIEQKERQRTQDQLEDIRESLIGFAMREGRLPCPDVTVPKDGLEDPAGGGGGCNSESGNLPYAQLGINSKDAWNREFVYRVTGSYADDVSETGCVTNSPTGVSFALCSNQGNIGVRDATGGSIIAAEVPAVIISHGKGRANPSDASSFERENYENSSVSGDTMRTVVFRNYSNASGNEFDDLLLWVSPYVLKNRMVQAGRLP